MPFTPPETSSEIKEGASAAKAVFFIGILAAIVFGAAIYSFRNVTLSSVTDILPSAVEDKATPISDGVPAAKVNKPQIVATAFPTTPVNSINPKTELGIELIVRKNTITILHKGNKIRDLELPKDARYWVGVVHDPYRPLVNLSGTPFFDGTNLPLKPSDNIVKLLDGNGQLVKDPSLFKAFPFFSESPTTVGFIEGFYDRSTFVGRVTLTFLNIENGQNLVIEYDRISFPEWFKKGGFPPAYAKFKYIYLVDRTKWYGDNVYGTVQRYRDGSYEETGNVLAALYEREFQQSQLSSKDLQILKNGDIYSATFNQPLYEASKKLTRYCYYGKKLGKSDLVKGLFPQLHASLQQAISSNRELKP